MAKDVCGAIGNKGATEHRQQLAIDEKVGSADRRVQSRGMPKGLRGNIQNFGGAAEYKLVRITIEHLAGDDGPDWLASEDDGNRDESQSGEIVNQCHLSGLKRLRDCRVG